LSWYTKNYRRKIQDQVKPIGGQPPKILRQFLAEQAHLFSVGSQMTKAVS